MATVQFLAATTDNLILQHNMVLLSRYIHDYMLVSFVLSSNSLKLFTIIIVINILAVLHQ